MPSRVGSKSGTIVKRGAGGRVMGSVKRIYKGDVSAKDRKTLTTKTGNKIVDANRALILKQKQAQAGKARRGVASGLLSKAKLTLARWGL